MYEQQLLGIVLVSFHLKNMQLLFATIMSRQLESKKCNFQGMTVFVCFKTFYPTYQDQMHTRQLMMPSPIHCQLVSCNIIDSVCGRLWASGIPVSLGKVRFLCKGKKKTSYLSIECLVPNGSQQTYSSWFDGVSLKSLWGWTRKGRIRCLTANMIHPTVWHGPCMQSSPTHSPPPIYQQWWEFCRLLSPMHELPAFVWSACHSSSPQDMMADSESHHSILQNRIGL